jgi:predicted RNase H-like HicB family nuclease
VSNIIKRKAVRKKSHYSSEELVDASRYEIVIQWSDEDHVYIARVPKLPGAVTHGDSPVEAAEKVVEGAAHWIYGSRQLGHPVPAPRVRACVTIRRRFSPSLPTHHDA